MKHTHNDELKLISKEREDLFKFGLGIFIVLLKRDRKSFYFLECNQLSKQLFSLRILSLSILINLSAFADIFMALNILKTNNKNPLNHERPTASIIIMLPSLYLF